MLKLKTKVSRWTQLSFQLSVCKNVNKQQLKKHSLSLKQQHSPPLLKYSPQRVQYGLAVGPATEDRFVLHRWQVWPLLEWGEEAGDRHYQPGSFQPARGPQVPTKTHAVPILILLDKLLVCCHGNFNGKESEEILNKLVWLNKRLNKQIQREVSPIAKLALAKGRQSVVASPRAV